MITRRQLRCGARATPDHAWVDVLCGVSVGSWGFHVSGCVSSPLALDVMVAHVPWLCSLDLFQAHCFRATHTQLTPAQSVSHPRHSIVLICRGHTRTWT